MSDHHLSDDVVELELIVVFKIDLKLLYYDTSEEI